jgi:hypothetical protein
MRRLRWLALATLLVVGLGAGCKSRWRPDGADAATPRPDGSGVVDGALDAGNAVRACIESPNDLPRPPTGRLPCELLPPGLGL